MDSLITSTLDCISRVWEMQPTLANNENRPTSPIASETSNSNDRTSDNSIASEVLRLFLTFRFVNGGQQSRRGGQRGILVNGRRRLPLGTDQNKRIISKNEETALKGCAQ